MLAVHPEYKKPETTAKQHYTTLNSSPYGNFTEGRKYLLATNDLGLITTQAAQIGDQLVLEFLLDAKPRDAEEIHFRKQFAEYLEKKARLERKLEIRKTQVAVIKNLYSEYGEEILQHRDEINTAPSSQLDELLYSYRLENRQMLASSKEIDINGVAVELDKALRVKLHKQFSNQLLEEFKSAGYRVGDNKFSMMIAALKNFFENHSATIKETQNHLTRQGFAVNQATLFRLLKALNVTVVSDNLGQMIFSQPVDYPQHLSQNHDEAQEPLLITWNEAHIFEFGELLKDTYRIANEINSLSKSHQPIIKIIERIEKARNKLNNDNTTLKYELLTKLYRDNYLQSITLEDIRRLEKMVEAKIKVTYSDPSTGNNLLHSALEHGQFETALYLIKKGVDYKAKNAQGILACDMQNNRGDTLLHYLVRRGNLDAACDLLTEGASSALVNHQQEHILDIRGNEPLIHYLLKKINTEGNNQEHLFLLVHLITQNAKLSTLLLRDSANQTVYSRLFAFRNGDTRDCILKCFKDIIIDMELTSQFQKDINLDLLRHFIYLLKKQEASWFSKKFLGVTENSIELHLCFLSNLQQKLLSAARDGTDVSLTKFIRNSLIKLHIPQELKKYYLIHLKTVLISAQLAKHRMPGEDQYYNLPNANKNSEEESSYVCIAKNGISDARLSDDSKASATLNTSGFNEKSFSSPLQQKAPAKNTKPNAIDPFHWFDDSSKMCILKK